MCQIFGLMEFRVKPSMILAVKLVVAQFWGNRKLKEPQILQYLIQFSISLP